MTLRKFVAVLLAGSAILHSGLAAAVGLGEVVQQSAIGEPLRLRVEIVGADDDVDASCLQLAPNHRSDLPWVRDARFAIERGSSGTFLVISNSRPVYDPILMLGVATRCEGHFRREYTLLLSAGPARSTGPAGPAAPGPAAAASPQSPAAPSLLDLAREQFPSDKAARRRFVAAAKHAAPQAFPNRASLRAPLPADLGLDVAALAESARQQPPQARTRAASRPTRSESRPPAAATRPPAQAPSVTAAPPPVVRASGDDRLVLLGGEPDVKLKLSYSLTEPGGENAPSEDERERLRQEQQMMLALDERIIKQMELAARMRELEELQARLKVESARLDQIAASQAPVASPPAASDIATAAPRAAAAAEAAASEPADRRTWGALAALAAVLVLLLVLLWRRRNRAQAEDEPESAGEMAIRSVDDELAPHVAGIGGEVDFPLEIDGTEAAVGGDSEDLTGELGAAGEPPSMDFAPLDWTPPPDELGSQAAAAPLATEDLTDEHESAVELADIMMSFGRVQGAAQTLSEFIRHNPKQGVAPWLKLLDVYKAADMRGEFDALTRELNRNFNVKVVAWDEFDAVKLAAETLESMPHIVARLDALWRSRDCQVYLHELLRDNRDGTRQGFPIAVVDEILCLLSVLNDLVGQFRPRPGDFKEAAPATNGEEAPAQGE